MKSRYSLASLVSLCAIALLTPSQGLSQTLQEVLDSLGYGYINVNEDETGIESFTVVQGETYYAEVLDSYLDSWYGVDFGYYVGDPDPLMGYGTTPIFVSAQNAEGMTDFTVAGADTFGFYVGWPDNGPFCYCFTEAGFNLLGLDHALVYETGETGEYIIAWEDEPDFVIGDFQDLVVKVSNVTPAGAPPSSDPPALIEVDIDICPDSDANPVNPTTGPPVIPVAIFGSADFDVADIKLSTLALDGDSPDTPGELGGIADPAEVVDVNGDGLSDLVVQFLNSQDGIVLGDVKGIVTGETLDGTPIRGEDDVKIVGRTKPKKPKK